jgi:hypothetical protein
MNTLSKVENIQDHGINVIMNDIDSVNGMAKKLMTTKHYQKMGEDGIFAICMAAKSNGIPIADALNGELYYVQGRVGMGYEAMNKYIRLAGHSVMIKHLDEKSCTLVGKRKDTGDTAEVTFDMNDAKRAGKTYDKHPKPMLFARALSMLKRFLFPDVLTKIYEKGELEDITSEVQFQDMKQVYVEEKKEEIPSTVSIAQAQELDNILEKCDPEVQKNLKDVIKKHFNIESLDNLPADEFERYKKILLIRMSEYQKKLVEAEMEKVKVEEEVQV